MPYTLLFFTALSLIFSYMGILSLSIFFGWVAVVRLLNRMASQLPFKNQIHWAHAMTFEFLAVVGVIFLRLIPSRHKFSGTSRPMLLVHGYVNHPNVWWLQKRWLKSMGLGPIYVINLGHPFKSIRSYAEKVKVKAEEIAKETGREDLTLIGHSMGGLVSSWYATKLAKKGTVRDLITIASPLEGTPMARIGIGANAREMSPNSEFIKELRVSIRENQSIHFHHIATRRDQLVIPGTSALIENHNQYLFDDLGHASLLYSKRTAEQIAERVSGN